MRKFSFARHAADPMANPISRYQFLQTFCQIFLYHWLAHQIAAHQPIKLLPSGGFGSLPLLGFRVTATDPDHEYQSILLRVIQAFDLLRELVAA